MELPAIASTLANWSAGKPLVSRVWVFGSRARGDHRSDSDVDVAIELDLAHSEGMDESGGLATWMFDTKGWREEIEALVPYKLDLQQYRGTDTPTIHKALATSSVLVYDKSGPNISLKRTDQSLRD